MVYLSPLERHCFSGSSACRWVRVVPLFWPICFCTHVGRSFFKSLWGMGRFVRLGRLVSLTGILMTFCLSMVLDLQSFFHWCVLRGWRLERPRVLLRPHHFRTCASGLTTVVKSVLKFMINWTTSILKSSVFQVCAAVYWLLLCVVFASHDWFVVQGPVAVVLISWGVIFIWETGYWTRAIGGFALCDLLEGLYSDTNILSRYIPSLQKKL